MEQTEFKTMCDELPKLDEKTIDQELRTALETLNKKIVVLDDDPTGTQTVHDVSIYTDWTIESLRKGFLEKNKLFFVLTNSRGFTKEKTLQVHQTIAERIAIVAKETDQDFLVINRGDSTLRGHYPLETEMLKATLEQESMTFDGEIIIPFFKEGGRLTIENVHYVNDGKRLVPAGETEFAKDRTFGYQSSDLRKWVEEKTAGNFDADTVITISLLELRNKQVNEIAEKLIKVTDFNKVIVNAVDYLDVKVFVISLIKALNQGKRFLYSSAAAFVKVLGGIPDQPLLTRKDIVNESNQNGGLIMVGSHVKKTTDQLNSLLKVDGIVPLEFQVSKVVDSQEFVAEQLRIRQLVNGYLQEGRTVVVYTERKRLDIGKDPEAELNLSVKIASAVSRIVHDLTCRPKFLIAKGGITSSDIATAGLGIKQAQVAGQIAPGIPVWLAGEESKFPKLPYIIFPGNVGEVDTLSRVVKQLK
ncbi:hydroxyacid dehydrogenase [Enterococcus sp. 669A]|uniref:Hydroxyacid dehydrogenase n=1 Tax=Candidatus Enterococcus moelleringii TaxID=2815325 RepID=A0ABS3LB21_9ENTE|nr:four-carbon acid sugar kinase family protein [Enterococcus sp. 669A]MBO1306837.1 hydroxyacid dehydrogenase [Enterococcus sp. 669A]